MEKPHHIANKFLVTPRRRQLSKPSSQSAFNRKLASIEDLICGTPVLSSSYVDIDHIGLIDRLRCDLAELHPQIQIAVSNKSELPSSAIFPFLARKFLELSLTAVLARIDPIRVIAARKNQKDTSFEVGRQNPSSVAWTDDIFPSTKTPPNSNWASQTLKNGIERSILGWHFGEVAISPGLRWLCDTDSSSSTWIRLLSSQDDPISWVKGKLGQLYSTLSKGVHAEYLLDDRSAFDYESVLQHTHDVYMLVTLLAASTHISPLFSRSLSTSSALKTLANIEQQILKIGK
jgi:hypothetical protein